MVMRKHGGSERRSRFGLFSVGKQARVSRVLQFRDASMPSVGTRRSTRVFVPKTVGNIGDSPVKELRSGKRLVLEGAGKPSAASGEEWIRLLGNPSDVSEGESEETKHNKKKKSRSLKNDGRDVAADRLLPWRKERSERKLRRLEHGGGDSGSVLSSVPRQKLSEWVGGRDGCGALLADQGAVGVSSHFRMFGITYSRKRRREGLTDGERMQSSEEHRMYGLSFTRKQRRKICKNSKINSPSQLIVLKEIPGNCIREIALFAKRLSSGLDEIGTEMGFSYQNFWQKNSRHAMLACIVEPSYSNSCYFANFLVSVLRSIGKPGFKVYSFAWFLFLESIASVFSDHGILFVPLLRSVKLDKCLCIKNRGITALEVSGEEITDSLRQCGCMLDWCSTMLAMLQESIAKENLLALKCRSRLLADPGICAIFGAYGSVPLLSLNFAALPTFFMHMHADMMLFGSKMHSWRWMTGWYLSAAHDLVSAKSSEDSQSQNLSGVAGTATLKKKRYSIVSARSKFLNHQKKRSSPHTVRAIRRSPLKDRLNVLMNETKSPPLMSDMSLRNRSFEKIKGLRILLEGLKQNIDTASCKANILVVDHDRCWRETGAFITLEASESKEWLLAVKSHGLTRYLHKPHEMRPCTSNRYTHAMMWTGEKGPRGWKLEFCDRNDWVVFKELYKECVERNAVSTPVRFIPTPVVREVPDYESTYSASFVRPSEYITDVDDEIGRALADDSVIYDIDSDDERWLNELRGHDEGCEHRELDTCKHIAADEFEKVMDRLEKIAFRQSDDISNIDVVTGLCTDLLEKDKVNVVYDYWLRKRKHKGKALVRVFQRPPMKRAQLIQKPFLRKKRSFKMTRSGRRQGGRGKPEAFLQEAAYAEELRRIRETQEAASKAREAAISKRRKAQSLMRTADLAVFKSVMAVRIAFAKQNSHVSPEDVD
ncbi:hypothetical protein EJ110_NYTH42323 [Nymphaea thermarum]|nr:hypothetical protein EJ110_NYTH42323 [Nymphaea thermarum]